VQANNIGLVYIIDSYRPIAGEVIITQSAFKGGNTTLRPASAPLIIRYLIVKTAVKIANICGSRLCIPS